MQSLRPNETGSGSGRPRRRVSENSEKRQSQLAAAAKLENWESLAMHSLASEETTAQARLRFEAVLLGLRKVPTGSAPPSHQQACVLQWGGGKRKRRKRRVKRRRAVSSSGRVADVSTDESYSTEVTTEEERSDASDEEAYGSMKGIDLTDLRGLDATSSADEMDIVSNLSYSDSEENDQRDDDSGDDDEDESEEEDET